MEDAKLRESIIEELSKQPTMVLATAMVYARHMVVHGVSVVEQWETAIQHSYALSQAEKYGYAKATENLKKQCEFCEYKNIILRQREKDGKQNGEI